MHSWVKAKWTRIAMFAVAFGVTADWLIADRWQVRGTVTDASSNKPIEHAWVIADFSGETPLINLPTPPHPNHRTDKCMGTRITRTDAGGRFLFDELTFNRPLANKSAHILIFKPGWIAAARSTPISSTLFLPSRTTFMQSLSKGPGRQQRKTIGWPEDLVAKLEPSEFARSDELFETLTIAGQRFCDPVGTEASVAAMKHALFIAKTFAEREHVRATCALAAEHARMATSGSVWPFDCRNLLFRHRPTDQVLAVEAEIEVQRNPMSK